MKNGYVEKGIPFIQKRKEKIKLKGSRIYYGGTSFERKELADTEINHRIELEYYKVKNEYNKQAVYGIEVVKREYKIEGVNMEVNNVIGVSDSINRVEEIIDKLKKHKVTPVCLNDVVEDILYEQITE